jgi:hypothetical protein
MAIRLTGLLLAAALGGCSMLTAEAPLFSPADQIGPPPLTEGVWIVVGEECPARYARHRTGRFPEGCTPMEIRRLEDGAWQARVRVDLIANLSADARAEAEAQAAAGPFRMILAPAVENASSEAYAPVYVAELAPRTAADSIGYAVVAPIGVMPATSALVVLAVGCVDILRQGPIDGVTERHVTRVDESGVPHDEVQGCIATSQAAVREAARRAVIENLDEMVERRLVFVRP